MSKRSNGSSGNGRRSAKQDIDTTDTALAEQAIEEAHSLPGYFPVVLIALSGTAFRRKLERATNKAQGDDPYRIRTHLSRNGKYSSYRVEMYVGSGAEALERKATLVQIPGVIMSI